MREGGGDKGEENKGQGRGDEGMKEGERTREESEGWGEGGDEEEEIKGQGRGDEGTKEQRKGIR